MKVSIIAHIKRRPVTCALQYNAHQCVCRVWWDAPTVRDYSKNLKHSWFITYCVSWQKQKTFKWNKCSFFGAVMCVLWLTNLVLGSHQRRAWHWSSRQLCRWLNPAAWQNKCILQRGILWVFVLKLTLTLCCQPNGISWEALTFLSFIKWWSVVVLKLLFYVFSTEICSQSSACGLGARNYGQCSIRGIRTAFSPWQLYFW